MGLLVIAAIIGFFWVCSKISQANREQQEREARARREAEQRRIREIQERAAAEERRKREAEEDIELENLFNSAAGMSTTPMTDKDDEEE